MDRDRRPAHSVQGGLKPGEIRGVGNIIGAHHLSKGVNTGIRATGPNRLNRRAHNALQCRVELSLNRTDAGLFSKPSKRSAVVGEIEA